MDQSMERPVADRSCLHGPRTLRSEAPGEVAEPAERAESRAEGLRTPAARPTRGVAVRIAFRARPCVWGGRNRGGCQQV